MSRAQRREMLVRACELDRLQIRLACAHADLQRTPAIRSHAKAAAVAISSVISRHVSLGDMLKIAAAFISKRQA